VWPTATAMRAAAGGREPSSSSAAVVALRALLIATACGLVFALLNLPDGRAGSAPPGESGTCPPPAGAAGGGTSY